MLGCPNLPQQPIQEEDGAAGVAERVGTEGMGCLFTAIRGQGSFVGPLNGEISSSLFFLIVAQCPYSPYRSATQETLCNLSDEGHQVVHCCEA